MEDGKIVNDDEKTEKDEKKKEKRKKEENKIERAFIFFWLTGSKMKYTYLTVQVTGSIQASDDKLACGQLCTEIRACCPVHIRSMQQIMAVSCL